MNIDDTLTLLFTHACQKSNIWIALYDLNSWHININDYPKLKAKFEEYKPKLIKSLIESLMKINDQYDTASVMQTLTRLEAIKVDWPELVIIRQSIEADK